MQARPQTYLMYLYYGNTLSYFTFMKIPALPLIDSYGRMTLSDFSNLEILSEFPIFKIMVYIVCNSQWLLLISYVLLLSTQAWAVMVTVLHISYIVR